MSHVSTAQLKLENVNADVLKEALMRVANKIGAQLVDASAIKDYYGDRVINSISGKQSGVLYGMVGGVLNYGVVVEVTKDGQVNLYGDMWGSTISMREMKQMINNEYTVEAIEESLLEMGMQVTGENEDEEEIVIMAME